MTEGVGVTGELMLGRAGVVLMSDAFCIAVALATVHVRSKQPAVWLFPTLLLGGALAWRTAAGVTAYVLSLALVGPTMLAATYLISPDRRTTLGRALSCAGAVLLFELAGPVFFFDSALAPSIRWLSWLFVPVAVLGFPVAIMLYLELAVRRHVWLAPVLSGALLVLSWAVWMARDHYYVIKYHR